MRSILKSRMLWGAVGFLLGAFVTNIGVVLSVRNLIVREYRSPLGFAATVDTIVSNAGIHGWKVGPLDPIRATAPDAKLRTVQVIELSQPAYAAEALKFGRNRCVAMTPYTITVYEENGQTYVSFINNGVIGRFFRQQAAGAMTKVRADEKEILAFLSRR